MESLEEILNPNPNRGEGLGLGRWDYVEMEIGGENNSQYRVLIINTDQGHTENIC